MVVPAPVGQSADLQSLLLSRPKRHFMQVLRSHQFGRPSESSTLVGPRVIDRPLLCPMRGRRRRRGAALSTYWDRHDSSPRRSPPGVSLRYFAADRATDYRRDQCRVAVCRSADRPGFFRPAAQPMQSRQPAHRYCWSLRYFRESPGAALPGPGVSCAGASMRGHRATTNSYVRRHRV